MESFWWFGAGVAVGAIAVLFILHHLWVKPLKQRIVDTEAMLAKEAAKAFNRATTRPGQHP